MTRLTDQAAFDAALGRLLAQDPLLATLIGVARPRLRRREAGFAGLAAIVIGQQVSPAAAEAIFARLSRHLGEVTAAAVQSAEDQALRACGLSGGKIATLRALAEAVTQGGLDLADLATHDPDIARARLTAIRGIGPWTADIFLLFGLGHADIWPAGDLALQEAARLALGLAARPGLREAAAIAERWRPLRGVAAHCLWLYYGSARAARAAGSRTKTETRKKTGTRDGRQT